MSVVFTPLPIYQFNIRDIVTQWFKGPSNQQHIDVSNNYGHISKWDVSNVWNMSSLFENQTTFDDDISQWNTHWVENMSSMFKGATSFNQPIGKWNTSAVENMGSMFNGATSFNQPIDTSGNYWGVSKVKDMSNMFKGASQFDQSLNSWNISMSTNTNGMLDETKNENYNNLSFNIPENVALNNETIKGAVFIWSLGSNNKNYTRLVQIHRDISKWDVSGVTNMSGLFQNKTTFNDDISGWNTSIVENMSSMFEGATKFNQPIGKWKTSNVTTMSGMFLNATNFNQPIDTSGNCWNTIKVKDMRHMFQNASSFDKSLSLIHI